MSLGVRLVRRLVDLIVLVPVGLSAVLDLPIAVASRGVRRLVDLTVLVPVGSIVERRLVVAGLLAVLAVPVRRPRERIMPGPIVVLTVVLAPLVGMPPTRTPTRVRVALGLVVRDLLGVTVGDRSGVGAHQNRTGLLGPRLRLCVVTSGRVEIVTSPSLQSVLVQLVRHGVPVALANVRAT